MLLELLRNLRLHTTIVVRRVVRGLEAREDTLVDVASTQVRRHDNDGVLEVHLATLRVRQATLLQDLEQRVEDIRVSLLDLVEEDNRERLATDLLRELAALVVADVAGRSTEEARGRVLLRELGHIQLDQCILVPEQELGQSLGQLGLTDTGRAGEDERTDRGGAGPSDLRGYGG